MPNIEITVAGKIATNTTPEVVIVCGNSDYSVTFDLDAEWDAEPKRVARFSYIRDGRLRHKDQPFEGSSVAVPVLSGVRQVTVGVYAGDLHTTTPAAVLCRLSALCGDSVEEITPAEKAGMQQQINELGDRLDDLEKGGTGSSGKPDDWSQNDPTAPDYIKNRTHYEEEVTEEVTLQFDVFYPAGTVRDLGKKLKTAKFLVDGVECVWVRTATTVPDVPFPCWISDGVTEYKITTLYNNQMALAFASDSPNKGESASATYLSTAVHVHKLDPKYLPDEVAARDPLLLNADSAETYQNDSSYGDEALEAIKTGRKILVRVPNADGGSYTAIYSPVLMYQVPNRENKYLYLFFLRDEKTDLTQLLGYSIQLPTYGQLKMLLSQEYNSNPLES